MMTQIGYHTLLLVCDWCICLYMNKTIWFVHDAWYTSLQLLECDVGVEVCLCVDLMVDLLALPLLVT